MQLAHHLPQHQVGSLNNGVSSIPEDDAASKNMAVALVAAGALKNSVSGLPAQIQQILSQQLLSSNQLQALMPQRAIATQQLAAAAWQLKKSSKASKSEETADNFAASKLLSNGLPTDLKQDQQQRIQQQLAFQQLMQLQQIQQQQVAATALHQQGLAAAVAMAQSRQQNFIQPEASSDLQQLLKHVSESSGRSDASLPISHGTGSSFASSDRTTATRNRTIGRSGRDGDGRRSSAHPPFGVSYTQPGSLSGSRFQSLYSHGVCQWPGCDQKCEDVSAFHMHLDAFHSLDDKSSAQYRVQKQVVRQLEKQLLQEKQRLNAMTIHLKVDKKERRYKTESNASPPINISIKEETSTPSSFPTQISAGNGCMSPLVPLQSPNATSSSFLSLNDQTTSTSPVSGQHLPSFSSSLFPFRSMSSSPPPLLPSNATSFNSSLGSNEDLQIAKRRHSTAIPEFSQNQEFYRDADVRPPFTYASLIRQAISEKKEGHMTLNEIYIWFQKRFAYFRQNTPTWKNAVRHNLSLHKCFVRVEHARGAVWTVDEGEYQKRRPPRLSGTPSIRGKTDIVASQNIYGGPMSLNALQMAFGDYSFNAPQLAGRTLLTANQLPAWNSNFGGQPHRLSTDGKQGGETSSLTSLASGSVRSLSPSSSSHSCKEETRDEAVLPQIAAIAFTPTDDNTNVTEKPISGDQRSPRNDGMGRDNRVSPNFNVPEELLRGDLD